MSNTSNDYSNKNINKFQSLLKIDNLYKRFGGVKALNGVNLNVEKGEIRCLIGPNGSGKTTIFNVITGVYQPTAGMVFFDGNRIDELASYQIARLGLSIKFQINNIYLGLTVLQNLRIPFQRSKRIKSDYDISLDYILELIGLQEERDLTAEILPHGKQKWLEIGMAMAIKPKMLLLDEPTAGMSPEETNQTANIIKMVNSKFDTTVIVVEHDMEFVELINQKVSVLNQGKVFFEGSIHDVKNNPGVRRIYLGEEE